MNPLHSGVVSDQEPWMPFCERYFSVFLLLWGILLEVDALADIPNGLFLRYFERYLPGWLWGAIMIGLAIGRFLAFRARSKTWRLRLSAATVALMTVIAAIAVFAQLFGATVPLTAFVAATSWWCHGELSRRLAI